MKIIQGPAKPEPVPKNTNWVVGTRENMSMIQEHTVKNPQTGGSVKVEILQYDKFMGNTNMHVARDLYFAQYSNIRAKQIAFTINNDGVKIEPGAMSYFIGPLQMQSGVTISNALSRAFTSWATKERFALPEYTGSGVLVLEPSFKHFIVLELDPGETIIVDKGMFYCAQSSVNLTPIMNSQVSGALLGGEGIFQQQMTGPGLVVLESHVPMCEIHRLQINNDVLRVDGNFAVLRKGDLMFTVERSANTLIGSAVSGEGLVDVFRGTGEVWLAPSLKIYEALAYGGELTRVNMNNSTGHAG